MGNSFIGFSSAHLVLTIVVFILAYLFEIVYFDNLFNAFFGLFVSYLAASLLLYFYREFSSKPRPEQKVIAFDAGGVYFDGSIVTPHFEPREGFPEFIAELKSKGYKVVMFTNQNKTVSDLVAEKFGLNEVFDAIFSSGEIKIAKPAKEAFETVIGLLGIKPENFIFVDDAAANVEGAKSVGGQGFVFESLEQLAADFAKAGLL
jgi:beta-phosphoglucomutase-like phosphatase (HAD superfamily)